MKSESNFNMVPDYEKDLISVVVPAYNAQLSLARCIKSILSQTYYPIEIIVVNDGSQDQTEQVAKQFAEQIIYINQENQGETAARNRGFSATRGEFVSFIDHDDYWAPEFVDECVNFLRNHHDAIAVSVASKHRSALSDVELMMPANYSIDVNETIASVYIDNFFSFWAKHNHICAGSAMIRRDVLRKSGGQRTDLALSGDLEFWAHLATFGHWGFIPTPLLFVDGTRVGLGNLYQKYYERYKKCTSVEDWERRIVPRLNPADWQGYELIRGRIATWYIFAKIFIKDDEDAYHTSVKYRKHLEGRYGTLWQLGSRFGFIVWKCLAIIVRLRIRIQYYLRDKTGKD